MGQILNIRKKGSLSQVFSSISQRIISIIFLNSLIFLNS